jgi:hypothetical protein
MADEPQRRSKRERQAARQREARARWRKTLLRRGGVLAPVLALPVLWLVDCTGQEETVQAEVLRTRLWRHVPQGGQAHTHTSATLVIEGLTEATLERGDGLERGQRIPVRIRRGRLTGWPYFGGLESAEGLALDEAEVPQAGSEEGGVLPEDVGEAEPVGAPEPAGDPEGGGLELEDANE